MLKIFIIINKVSLWSQNKQQINLTSPYIYLQDDVIDKMEFFAEQYLIFLKYFARIWSLMLMVLQ